jgi:hypothetical protein
MFPKHSWLLAQLLLVPQLLLVLQLPGLWLQELSLPELQLIAPVSVLLHLLWPAVLESMLQELPQLLLQQSPQELSP